jgi:hypothetical protein
MPSNIIGIRNNNVLVPYSAATKRTKELDISVYCTGNPAFSAVTAKCMFYADSSNNWRMIFNIRGAVASGSRTSQTCTIAGIVFKSTSDFYQTVTAGSDSGSAVAGYGYTTPSGGVLTMQHGTATTTSYSYSGDVELDAEPTWSSLGTTAAAAMEGLTAVDVWIGPQVPGVSAGLVPAQGLDGRTDGVAVPAGKVGETTGIASGNSTGTASASLTLTAGRWLVHGICDCATASPTSVYARYVVKGVNGSYSENTTSTSAATSISLLMIVVDVANSDSDKTVSIQAGAGAAVSKTVKIIAIRIA